MTTSHPGFELIKETAVPEIASTARHWRHKATGAELLSFANGDANKAFGIAFRTLPEDHTGVAHILEHCVLSGSRKYPVKELFTELTKSSCATFLNAMTYPDKTLYPVASTNLKDFYNLIDVYLDVVLHPLLESHALDQEGWHLELDRPDGELAYRGVVFNEMKGVYGTADAVIEEDAMAALMPDTIYAKRSGGLPSDIPKLTHEQWRGFHKRFYHPSNARIVFWGDDPEAERLRIIDEALAGFDRQIDDTPIALQPRFNAPRHATAPAPASEAMAREGRGNVSISWMLADASEPAERQLADALLVDILVGSHASPLRKAMLESGLGEDLLGGYVSRHTRQRTFVVGLKGVLEADHANVEPLVLATLERLARDGFEPAAIEASLNSTEFALREMNTPQRGVRVLTNALESWNYGGEPLTTVAFAAPLAALKSSLAANPRLFEDLMRERLIENPHRSTMWHAPDAGLLARQDAEEKAELKRIEATLTPADRARIAAETAELKRRQEAPNAPEQLAKLPVLRLADLDRRNQAIPREIGTLGGRPLVLHPLATTGIAYVDVALSLAGLTTEELLYVSVLARAIVELGTSREDDVQIAQRIDRYTGGISPSTVAMGRADGPGTAAFLVFRGKATIARTAELAAILRDLLIEARLDQREQMLRIALEDKTRIESSLLMAGTHFCKLRLSAGLHEAGIVNEQIDGISQLFFVRRLVTDIEKDWPSVLARFEAVRRKLVVREAATVNVTVDRAGWSVVGPQVEALVTALPAGSCTPVQWRPLGLARREGLALATQVNYMAQGADARPCGFRPSGEALAINAWIGRAWLIPKVREQGGAYGAGASIDLRTGEFVQTSYRDPNLLATIDAFNATAGFLRTLDIGDADVTRAIIASVNGIDPYQLPGAQGYTSFLRHLVGQSEAMRQQRRDELFATTPRHFREFADIAERVSADAGVVVMASPEALAEANKAKGDGYLTPIAVM